MNLIECDACECSFKDSFMWWSGHFWLCFDCAIKFEERDF